jgi:histone deacetylase 1/2
MGFDRRPEPGTPCSERCQQEHALYRRSNDKSSLLISVYVDDLIITGSSNDAIGEFKQQMHGVFRMSDLRLLSYYLGIEVDQHDGSVTLSQVGYATKILEAAGMQECNTCHTPMDTRLKVGKQNGGDAVDATMYHSVIASLRYLVTQGLTWLMQLALQADSWSPQVFIIGHW